LLFENQQSQVDVQNTDST